MQQMIISIESVKIDKKTGKIVKEHKYYDENYIQHYIGNIAYGEGKNLCRI